MKRTGVPKIFAVDVLERIRKELILYIFLFLLCWAGIFFIFPYMFPYLVHPYFNILKGKPLVFTSMEEALFVVLRATFYITFAITLPFLVFRLGKAISEEFYDYEKKIAKKLFFISIFFGIAGILVGYFLVIPFVLKIFLYFGRDFTANIRISSFLLFVLKVVFFCVLIFQTPLILAILVKEEIITEEFYKKRRLYFLGFFYGISVLIAPTDLFSQILLTLFFFLFFKVSFLVARFLA